MTQDLATLQKQLLELTKQIETLQSERKDRFMDAFMETCDKEFFESLSDKQLTDVGRYIGKLFNNARPSLEKSTPDVPSDTKEPQSKPDETSVKKQTKWAYYDTSGLPALSQEEKEWQARISKMIKDYTYRPDTKDNYTNLLKKLYRIITTRYGIVWDQTKKDYKNYNNIDEDIHVSTFRVIVCDVHLRSIFESLLKDYIANNPPEGEK